MPDLIPAVPVSSNAGSTSRNAWRSGDRASADPCVAEFSAASNRANAPALSPAASCRAIESASTWFMPRNLPTSASAAAPGASIAAAIPVAALSTVSLNTRAISTLSSTRLVSCACVPANCGDALMTPLALMASARDRPGVCCEAATPAAVASKASDA